MKKVLIVDGMMCAHCQAHVQKALAAVDGVSEAVVDLEIQKGHCHSLQGCGGSSADGRCHRGGIHPCQLRGDGLSCGKQALTALVKHGIILAEKDAVPFPAPHFCGTTNRRSKSMYRLIKKEGSARRGEFVTVHGTVQTPAFMNVATAGAIKGAVSAYDLKDLHCQVQLCNTYHLHLRPGDETVKKLGGIRKFTGWDGPVLTDSGGFQVFSLAKLRNIKEEGVTFASHVDGHNIFMGPEESMRIQSNLGSTIAMAFDECVENPATYEYAKSSCERTARWLERCKREMARLNSLEETINPHQLLFGINQGCTFEDLAGGAHETHRRAGPGRLCHRRPGCRGAH